MQASWFMRVSMIDADPAGGDGHDKSRVSPNGQGLLVAEPSEDIDELAQRAAE